MDIIASALFDDEQRDKANKNDENRKNKKNDKTPHKPTPHKPTPTAKGISDAAALELTPSHSLAQILPRIHTQPAWGAAEYRDSLYCAATLPGEGRGGNQIGGDGWLGDERGLDESSHFQNIAYHPGFDQSPLELGLKQLNQARATTTSVTETATRATGVTSASESNTSGTKDKDKEAENRTETEREVDREAVDQNEGWWKKQESQQVEILKTSAPVQLPVRIYDSADV